MNISSPELVGLLRLMPSDAAIPVRDGDGKFIMSASRHEAELLLDNAHVEGIGNRHGFKYLRLTVAARTATAMLRRRLCSSARTVSEACQLTVVQEVCGRRVLYAHHTRRTNTYRPELRQGSHPTYAALIERSA